MVDLENVSNLWYYRAETLIGELHGLNITDTEDVREKATVRSQKADYSRRLLELADLFALMESITRQEYWIMKGSGVFIEMGDLSL